MHPAIAPFSDLISHFFPFFWGRDEFPNGTYSRATYSYNEARNEITILQRLSVRVGWPIRPGSPFVFGVEMPYAGMILQVRVKLPDGDADLHIRHSAVPSIMTLRIEPGGLPIVGPASDMLWIDPNSIASFFESETILPAEYIQPNGRAVISDQDDAA